MKAEKRRQLLADIGKDKIQWRLLTCHVFNGKPFTRRRRMKGILVYINHHGAQAAAYRYSTSVKFEVNQKNAEKIAKLVNAKLKQAHVYKVEFCGQRIFHFKQPSQAGKSSAQDFDKQPVD